MEMGRWICWYLLHMKTVSFLKLEPSTGLDVASTLGETLSIDFDWQIDGVNIASNTGEHFWVGDFDSQGADDVLIGVPF